MADKTNAAIKSMDLHVEEKLVSLKIRKGDGTQCPQKSTKSHELSQELLCQEAVAYSTPERRHSGTVGKAACDPIGGVGQMIWVCKMFM